MEPAQSVPDAKYDVIYINGNLLYHYVLIQ